LNAAAQITRQLKIDDAEALALFQSSLNEWTKDESSDPQ
jgi:hypothetical protein